MKRPATIAEHQGDRDKLAKRYASAGEQTDTGLMLAFRAGWDARDETVRLLAEAADFAHMAIGHAIELGYVGEGSTLGMFNDALAKLDRALRAAGLEGK